MSEQYDVLVTLSTFAEYSDEPLKLLEKSGLSFKVNQSGKRMTPEEILDQGPLCRGLVAGVEKYSAETMAEMPNLEAISRVGVGIDSIDLAEAKRRNIAVLNTPEEPVTAVAELTLGAMLGLMRQLPKVTALTRDRKWQRVPGNVLQAQTVGIVGLGRIGRRVAELVKAFGSKIIGTDLYPDKEWAEASGVSLVSFDELLEQADVVSLHASAGDSPIKIGKAEIERMKKGAWVINMARGDMVDDAALAEALESGRLSGAALDVFPQEPYTGPLCEIDKVILTPHQATLNYETRVQMEVHAVQNLIDFFSGK